MFYRWFGGWSERSQDKYGFCLWFICGGRHADSSQTRWEDGAILQDIHGVKEVIIILAHRSFHNIDFGNSENSLTICKTRKMLSP